ncbi:MAG TPA: methyltransferase domain-containing protein [Acidimicrobiales bacterium]|nr:methyltransferase domain-containing protein [Acidimicrobiales bacterium]
MPVVNFPYIDAEIEHMANGGEPPGYWRHFHWGLFADPAVEDDTPERYFAAGEDMTERIVAAAGVTDGSRVLDVGCGFGGTLDHVGARNRGCRLAGLNIDERQLRHARRLLARDGRAPGGPPPFLAGDGCALPVATGSHDHVLAVECVFHFPSRKAFFREAARILRPGGTLALSDFLLAPGSIGQVNANVNQLGLGPWFGRSSTPLTPAGYARLGRSVGLDLLADEDVTARTLPTYPALRRLYRESGAEDGVATIDGCEALARAGGWEYHVLAFRRRGAARPDTGERP